MKENSVNKTNKENVFVQIITYALAFGMIINCNSIFSTGLFASRINNSLLLLSFLEVFLIVILQKIKTIDWGKYLVSILALSGYLVIYILLQQKFSTPFTSIKMLFTFLIFFSLAYLVYKTDISPLLLDAYVNLITVISIISLFFWIFG